MSFTHGPQKSVKKLNPILEAFEQGMVYTDDPNLTIERQPDGRLKLGLRDLPKVAPGETEPPPIDCTPGNGLPLDAPTSVSCAISGSISGSVDPCINVANDFAGGTITQPFLGFSGPLTADEESSSLGSWCESNTTDTSNFDPTYGFSYICAEEGNGNVGYIYWDFSINLRYGMVNGDTGWHLLLWVNDEILVTSCPCIIPDYSLGFVNHFLGASASGTVVVNTGPFTFIFVITSS